MTGALVKHDPAPGHVTSASTPGADVRRSRRRRRPPAWARWSLGALLAALAVGFVHVVTAPDPVDTRFGASPFNNAAGPSVVTKWGAGASVRIFAQDIAAPTHPVGASTVHTSFALLNYGVSRDQALRDVSAGRYDAQIAAAAEGTPAGDSIELVHEADKKITDGHTTWEVVLAAKNHFYDVAKAVNPDVLITNTVTAWTAEPTSGRDFERWGQIRADIIGIDCDGLNPATGDYPSYEAEVDAAVDFVESHSSAGYRYWAVPEFTAARQVSDTYGTKRAAWITDMAQEFRSNGALYVDYFDYNNTSGEALELPSEIAAWKAFVH